MSPPEVWGPAVWIFLHTLSGRINENAYPYLKNQLFSIIVAVCKVLPCPDCSNDASKFLAKININDIKTKTEFKNMLYLFHNKVNAKKRKPLFNYSNLIIYENFPLIQVINNFINKYNTKGNMKLLAESFQRTLIIKSFKSWFTSNIKAFLPPQNTIIQSIKDSTEHNQIIEELTKLNDTSETQEENKESTSEN